MKTIKITLKHFFPLLFLFFLTFEKNHAQSNHSAMNNEQLQKVLIHENINLEGEKGSWYFSYGNHIMMIVTDENFNRVRVFSLIIEDHLLEEGQMQRMLEANFHSALDAKYSLFDGYVISVFTHPLKELSKKQLFDAMNQVVSLANTFGDSYSSSLPIRTHTKKENSRSKDSKNNIRINKSPSRS